MYVKQYPITAMSDYAASLLKSGACGTIHSVYRKTINLSIEGQLFALQSSTSPLSPISLITGLSAEEMDFLEFSPQDPVLVQDQAILLGGRCCFSFSHARICSLKLSIGLMPSDLNLLEEKLSLALSLQNAGSFELLFSAPDRTDTIPFLKAAKLRLDEADFFLQHQQWEEASRCLCRLIGLGLGLTPGGDDFLCGLLAGLILSGFKAHPFAKELSDQIRSHLCDTNDISSAFLCCALEDQFSLAVNHLPLLNTPAEILSLFREIGHSSGTDTLCGICYLLKNRMLFL